jgi:signal transduction histidine kinase
MESKVRLRRSARGRIENSHTGVGTALSVLQLTSLAGFLAIAALAFREWWRLRNPSQMYLAAAIGSLAVVSLLGQVGKLLPSGLRIVEGDVAVVGFLGSGLALLLFRDTVIPLPRRMRTLAIGVTAAVAAFSVVIGFLGPSAGQPRALQLAYLVALVGTWSLSVGEPSVRLWLTARRLPAVQRARLRALAMGYLGIIVILLLAVGSAAFSSSAATSPAMSLVTGIAVLLLLGPLYAGFAPPAWLRGIWRQGEEKNFQAATHDLLMFSPDRIVFAQRALQWALRLSGAMSGYVAHPETEILATSGLSRERAMSLSRELGTIGEARLARTSAGNALVGPLPIDGVTGALVLLAGPFTPVFALDEVAWVNQYATLVAAGLDRVRLVEQMTALNAELERKVDEVSRRTAELQAANKELEAFSYTVSHDLRAPLRAINGFTTILLDEHAAALSPEARDFLQRISDSGHHMGRLVDDLLAFSRLGRQALRTEVVAVGPVVEHAWSLQNSTLDGRQVELKVQDLPTVEADPVLLEQIFANLLGNAVKYTRKRPVAHIEVGVLDELAQGQPVFYVKDDGAGFDMQYVDKLFGVFQRLHRSTDYEGTGVGLAIVQRIVQRHGGRVWAQAELDKGATFYFTIGGGTREWQKAA